MKRLLTILFGFALLAIANENDVETRLTSDIQSARQSLNQTLLRNQQEKARLLLEIQNVNQKTSDATAKHAKETASAVSFIMRGFSCAVYFCL